MNMQSLISPYYLLSYQLGAWLPCSSSQNDTAALVRQQMCERLRNTEENFLMLQNLLFTMCVYFAFITAVRSVH